MPFTLAHTIAVLPFRKISRNYISISGLLMGSMAPDFEFFLRITLYGIWGHTFWGIFLFDLPVSLFLCLLFHQVIKKNLINILPKPLYQRFFKYQDQHWGRYLKEHFWVVIYSILLGILSHFVWDNFTHEPNYVSPFYVDFLLKNLHILGKDIPLYHFLQFVSSGLGMAGFLLCIYYLPSYQTAYQWNKGKSLYFAVRVLTCAIFIFFIRYLIGVPEEKPLGQFVIISISSLLIGLTLVSWWEKIKS